MTLQELKFIIALYEENHFHKAAEKCFVSQPTLSIAVKKLEKELGVDLFERNKNKVRVTEIGERIVNAAKNVLLEANNIKQIVDADKDQLGSVFKLGAIYTVGPYILPPLIAKLSQYDPVMPFEIQESYTSVLKEKLLAGSLDAIIISMPFAGPGIVTKPIYEEPFVVLMQANHPLAKFENISELQLSKYEVLMLGEGHCFKDQVLASCPACFSLEKNPEKLNWRSLEGGSLETLRHMVASGMGVTILPSSSANISPYYDNILVKRPLKASPASRKVALAWRNSFPRIKAIERIIEAISHVKNEIFLKNN